MLCSIVVVLIAVRDGVPHLFAFVAAVDWMVHIYHNLHVVFATVLPNGAVPLPVCVNRLLLLRV